MVAKLAKAMSKSLDAPDEMAEFPNGRVDTVHLEELTVGRVVLMPGWRWSKDVKPKVGTESCQSQHSQYAISGRLVVEMDDGTRLEIKPGDVAVIPPGHDAWVVGDEPFVAVDFTGMKDYLKHGHGGRRGR